MAMTLPDREERRQFGRRWMRRLLVLALLAAIGWAALTSYYFRWDLMTDLGLLWANRGDAALEYAPALAGMFDPPPSAVPMEEVLRGRFPRPIEADISIADVLIGNAVQHLQDIVPIIAYPALGLLLVGVVLAWLGSRLLRLVHPAEFRRIWPAILVPTLIAFAAGGAFGAASLTYQTQIAKLLGL